MKSQSLLTGLLGLAGLATAGRRDYAADPLFQRLHPNFQMPTVQRREAAAPAKNDDVLPPRFLTNATEKFAVDGKNLPEIDWDVGESYSGLLPISEDKNETSELFFWFFPTATKEFADKKEIVLWLNGGPGCSSLLGFLEENGPIAWGEGMPKPKPNPFSFHLLSNIVWVEQPVGTGFTKGTPTVHNEDDIAEQFLGFWKNFIKTFAMEGYKVYIAGESYAGMYGPFIAEHMLDANDKDYYDLTGLLIWDGLMFDGEMQSTPPAFAYLEQHYNLMPVERPVLEELRQTDKECGFYDYLRKYLVYPPAGPMPRNLPGIKVYPNGTKEYENPKCGDLFNKIYAEALKKNPCFNIYNVVDRCPERQDPLSGKDNYFKRKDVVKAIHAPEDVEWAQCKSVFPPDGYDESDPSGVRVLPKVIDKTKNVIIAEGTSDYLLPLNGILLGIQNMTWGCNLGFQKQPSEPFFVPAYGFDPDLLMQGEGDEDFYANELPAGYGVMGTTHVERGLTLVVSQLAGHEGPEYTPGAAFRTLEKLLGRIDSLSKKGTFTLPQLRNVTQPKGELGNGTVTIPCYGKGC